MVRVRTTDVEVFLLYLGGYFFGWTAGGRQSFAVLDACKEAGCDFVDTAGAYSARAPGNAGGESETILGRWMADYRNRGLLVVATKAESSRA
jgi:aryl-alcohol dehydrogenase-like predicted oxidoreductase